MLRRNLIPGGNLYNSYFPSVNCEVFKTGKGDPGYILNFMKAVVDKHYMQVKKLAKELKKPNLKDTCRAFFEFQYNYIQYDVDGYQQRVLSPACAWNNRTKGMDCKSFTVFSAALCNAVGIKSYMRQVKQYDDRISHVYLVVPVNQITGSLNDGHYVIDATTADNKEVFYSWKNDLKMNPDLPVQGMNSPGMGCDYKIKPYVEDTSGMGFSFGDISGLLGGGSDGSDGGAAGDLLSTGGLIAGGPLGAGIGSIVGDLIGGAFTTAGSPDQGKEDALLDGQHFLKTSGIEFAVNDQTFNRFIFLTENYYQARFAKSKWDQSAATKEGNRLAAEGMKDLQNATMQEVQKSYNVKQTGTVPMAADRSISTVGGWHGTTLPTTAFGSWTVPTYTLTPKSQSIDLVGNSVVGPDGKPVARQNGFSTTTIVISLVVLLSAIVGGTIYFKNKN